MMTFRVIVILFLIFNFIHSLKGEDEKKLEWPKEYHMKGDKFDVKTGILLPFEIWYSEKHNRSRIDLGGSVKYYYDLESNETDFFAIHPVSNENEVSEMMCYKSADDRRYMLLNATGFKYTGRSSILFGRQVDEWSKFETYKGIYNKDTILYVYINSDGRTLPARMINKGYGSSKLKVPTFTVTDYHLFDSNVREKDITPSMEDCKNNPELKMDLRFLHPDQPGAVDIAFRSYMKQHNKTYHEKEANSRKEILDENWRLVIEHNLKDDGFKLEINKFSDQTDQELRYLTGTYVNKDTLLKYAKILPRTFKEIDALPEKYDSREEGLVTPVKDQSLCGSCWAFSVAAAIEVAIGKWNGTKLMDLSEQSLIDCGWAHNLTGCEGGDSSYALEQVMEHGIATEFEYPYKAIDGFCKITNMSRIYKITDLVVELDVGNNDIKQAIYKYGAVVVNVKATTLMAQYSHGIFYEELDCEWPNKINHAVTLVGYGVHEGEEYWLAKNSWGDAWGEAGYIRLSVRNCFISDVILYPIP